MTAEVAVAYDETEERPDIEADVVQTFDTQLPAKGMQVHSEYTLYGHFFFLKCLLGGIEKVRFFVDQESSIRTACFAAFARRSRHAGPMHSTFGSTRS
ncbi:MAG: hypothetical protein ACYDHY_15190 [Acidiferrobacterales bacterium]